MFSGKVTVRIEKDNNTMKYIKIIRGFDNTLPMGQIKKAIENGDVVFSFDSDNNVFIANGTDNSHKSTEYYFIKTLRELKKNGARMVVYEEDWGHECEEFSAPVRSGRSDGLGKTAKSVMDKIVNKWKLPGDYLEYLRTHPESRVIETEDEDTLDRIFINLYGANDLISCQDGYSYDPVEKCEIADWDQDLVVIADMDGDPFCIDISEEKSPVLYAMHGMDEWDFDEYCESFEAFIGILMDP